MFGSICEVQKRNVEEELRKVQQEIYEMKDRQEYYQQKSNERDQELQRISQEQDAGMCVHVPVMSVGPP